MCIRDRATGQLVRGARGLPGHGRHARDHAVDHATRNVLARLTATDQADDLAFGKHRAHAGKLGRLAGTRQILSLIHIFTAPKGQAMTQLLQPMQLSSLTPMRWFFGSKNKAPVGQAFAHGASSQPFYKIQIIYVEWKT